MNERLFLNNLKRQNDLNKTTYLKLEADTPHANIPVTTKN